MLVVIYHFICILPHLYTYTIGKKDYGNGSQIFKGLQNSLKSL